MTVGQLRTHPEHALLHLFYFRPGSLGCTGLDGKLFDLAARYRGRLHLVVKHSDEPTHAFGAWVSGRFPTVLMIRGGRSVAQFVGDLPEVDNKYMIQSALGRGAERR
jgi:thioredoxin-like negative regulator of GroEL